MAFAFVPGLTSFYFTNQILAGTGSIEYLFGSLLAMQVIQLGADNRMSSQGLQPSWAWKAGLIAGIGLLGSTLALAVFFKQNEDQIRKIMQRDPNRVHNIKSARQLEEEDTIKMAKEMRLSVQTPDLRLLEKDYGIK